MSPCRDERPAVLGRFFAFDAKGTGLRATWRPARGFVNLSLWRGDTCVETFHLTPADAAQLVSFLVHGMAATAPPPAPPAPVRLVRDDDPPAGQAAGARSLSRSARGARKRLATVLDRLSHQVRPGD